MLDFQDSIFVVLRERSSSRPSSLQWVQITSSDAESILAEVSFWFIQSLLSVGKKQLSIQFQPRLGQIYPVEPEIKDTTIRLLSVVDRKECSGNFTLPFTINATISISISQTFYSWEIIFHLFPPDHTLCPGLFLIRINVLFRGSGDFPINYSNRTWNAWNRTRLKKSWGRLVNFIK